MKNPLILLLLLVLTATTVAQDRPIRRQPATAVIGKACRSLDGCNGTDQLRINTGVHPQTGAVLPPGSVDPSWKLMNHPPLTQPITQTVSIPTAHVIPRHQPTQNWNSVTGAGIISPVNTPAFGADNLYSDQPWRFRRDFCLCQRDRLKISGLMRADDRGSINLYKADGTLLQSIATAPTYAFQSDNPFDMELTLPTGSYYLEFHLFNTSGVATGFSLSGSIRSLTRSQFIQSPSKTCCNRGGFISVQKILEKNCNGKMDENEVAGAGWTFDLANGNGQTIQTVTTNTSGEATFQNLTPGTYTVSERPQSGWVASEPVSGKKEVTIRPNGGAQITFFNCESNIEYCCPGENLVRNPSFEQPHEHSDINSEFLYTDDVAPNSVVPGKYNLITGAEAAQISQSWVNVQDPSTCDDNTGHFLAINGQTGGSPLQRTEPVPPRKIVWQQNFTINNWQHYKFCFKAKNLVQVGFPITPVIDVIINNGGTDQSLYGVTIDSQTGACNWTTVEKTFNYYGSGSNNLTIQIVLHQTEHGDGNDLALDDIALIALESCPEEVAQFAASVNPQGNHFTVSVTSNLTANCDKGAWAVCPLQPNSTDCQPGARIYNPPAWYFPNTNFPGYDGSTDQLSGTAPGKFQYGQLYRIERGVFGDCHHWNQFVMIVGVEPTSNRVVQFTEAEFKARKAEILRRFSTRRN